VQLQTTTKCVKWVYAYTNYTDINALKKQDRNQDLPLEAWEQNQEQSDQKIVRQNNLGCTQSLRPQH